jgi:hypothetical protein
MKRLNALPGTAADTAQAKAVNKRIGRIEEGMDMCSSLIIQLSSSGVAYLGSRHGTLRVAAKARFTHRA